jgi:LPXTG-motif cell wall-anchored protein
LASGEVTSVSGRGYVENTGNFLDFNGSPYNSNVVIDEDGVFSGYAWSEDLGWIDFGNVAVGGPVEVNFNSGIVSRRAYVLNTGGFLDFSNSPYNSNVVLDMETEEFTGFVWSNDVGWIDFATPGVTASNLPETGANISSALIVGAALLAVSMTLYLMLRKRLVK